VPQLQPNQNDIHKKICFIIAPIGDPDSEIRIRSDLILKHIISPAAIACGYNPIRADQISEPGLINNQVIRYLINSQLVIADLTGHNPNVFYELAIRHFLKKPLLQIIRKGEKIPFDIAQTRVVIFDVDLDSAHTAREDLENQIKAIENQRFNVETPISIAMGEIDPSIKVNPIFRGREPPPPVENNLCYVLIPFGKKQIDGRVIDFDSVYEDYIKPALKHAGFRVMNASDAITPGGYVMEGIWKIINRSRLLVADVTGKNPNVLYELGIAHTVGKDVIIVTQNNYDVPYDLRHLGYFVYIADDESGKQELQDHIENVAKDIRSKINYPDY
jgi:hypothetical protein